MCPHGVPLENVYFSITKSQTILKYRYKYMVCYNVNIIVIIM